MLALFKNASSRCSNICVVWEYVPCTPHDVFKFCERNKVLHDWVALFGALAEADGSHLGHGPDGGSLAALCELDAGNKSGSHCAKANGENTELSFGGGNGARFRHGVQARRHEPPHLGYGF